MSLRLSVLPLASLLAIAVSTAPLTAKPRGNISPPSAGAGAEIVEGEVLFVFAGGSPRDFITQVQETFPFLRWADVLTIPEAEFRDVRVPEIRARVHTPAQLLRLYNGLAQTQPELGRWAIVQGDNPEAWSEREEDFSSERPVAVRLRPVPVSRGQPVTSWAFPLAGIPESEWGRIEETLRFAERAAAAAETDARDAEPQGRISIDASTATLVAVGPKPYLELVDSVLIATRQNLATARRQP